MRTERLLEINNRRLDQLFEELEVTEGELTPELEIELEAIIKCSKEDILDAVRMIQNMAASVETSKLWEKKRRERRKRKEKYIERMRALVAESLERFELDRLEDPETGDKVRLQESQGQLEFDRDRVPDLYKYEEKVVKVDKELLRLHTEENGGTLANEGEVVARIVKNRFCVIW